MATISVQSKFPFRFIYSPIPRERNHFSFEKKKIYKFMAKSIEAEIDFRYSIPQLNSIASISILPNFKRNKISPPSSFDSQAED
jgi:hypothetical protein